MSAAASPSPDEGRIVVVGWKDRLKWSRILSIVSSDESVESLSDDEIEESSSLWSIDGTVDRGGGIIATAGVAIVATAEQRKSRPKHWRESTIYSPVYQGIVQ
jgi:hypothetical protein